MKEHRLCYVEGNFAYFSNDFEKQWGDDWNDAPYEHNAGAPYQDNEGQIIKVAWDGLFETPADMATRCNSNYSVEMINKGAIAWLTDRYSSEKTCIPAGVTIEEFTALIEKGEGQVYLPKGLE